MATDRHWPSLASRLRSPQGRPGKNNTYQTVRELVDHAVRIHLLAAERFSRLCPHTTNPRTRLLLQNIVRHEQDLELLLREFAAEADENTLVTWLQYTQEVHPEEILRAVLPPEGEALTIENLSRASQGLHDYLVELFQLALEEVASEHARQFFANLLHIERARRRQFTRVINSLMDM